MQTAIAYDIPNKIIQRARQLGAHFDLHCRQHSGSIEGLNSGDNDVVSDASPIGDEENIDSKKHSDYNLADAAAVLTNIFTSIMYRGEGGSSQIAALTDFSRDIIHVSTEQDPPPSLDGHSCVYIMHISGSKKNFQVYILCSFYFSLFSLL